MKTTITREQRKLQGFVKRVETSYFRTDADTGAYENVMMIWNLVRIRAGMKPLLISDLPTWCAKCKKYHTRPICP